MRRAQTCKGYWEVKRHAKQYGSSCRTFGDRSTGKTDTKRRERKDGEIDGGQRKRRRGKKTNGVEVLDLFAPSLVHSSKAELESRDGSQVETDNDSSKRVKVVEVQQFLKRREKKKEKRVPERKEGE